MASVANSNILTIYQRRPHLSQMHTTIYGPFTRKKAALWRGKNWASRGPHPNPILNPQLHGLRLNQQRTYRCRTDDRRWRHSGQDGGWRRGHVTIMGRRWLVDAPRKVRRRQQRWWSVRAGGFREQFDRAENRRRSSPCWWRHRVLFVVLWWRNSGFPNGFSKRLLLLQGTMVITELRYTRWRHKLTVNTRWSNKKACVELWHGV